MPEKKPKSNKPAKPRFSAASRMLGSELRATLQTPPTEEPWRTKIAKGKGGRRG